MPIPYTIHEDDADLVRVSPPSSTAELAAYQPKPAARAADASDQSAPDVKPAIAKDEPGRGSDANDVKQNVKQDVKHDVERDVKSDVKHEVEDDGGKGSDGMQPPERAKKEVQAALDEAARRIKEQSDRFQRVAVPAATRVRDFAERRPILFTFAVIWLALSALPILCFAGFVLCTAGVVVGIAAIGICLSMLTTILLGATLLLPVLFLTTCLSASLLSGLIGLFLAHRLYLHVAASVSASGARTVSAAAVVPGVQAWAAETRDRAGALVGRAQGDVVVVVRADKDGEATPLAQAVAARLAQPADAPELAQPGPRGAARAGFDGGGGPGGMGGGHGPGSASGAATEFDTTESEGTSWSSVSVPVSLG